MYKVKLVLVILLASLTVSCASTTYYAEIAPRFNRKTEQRSTFDAISGREVRQNFYSEGYGVQISLIQEWKFLFSRISYHESFHGDIEVVTDFGASSQEIESSQNPAGFDFSLGLNFGYFKPYIVHSISYDKDSYRDDNSYYGYGLRLEMPIGTNLSIALDYNRKEDRYGEFLGYDYEDIDTVFYIGLVFGGWNFERAQSSKKSKNQRRPSFRGSSR